jgi:diguanylate cyclase (GGDEF)-like protein
MIKWLLFLYKNFSISKKLSTMSILSAFLNASIVIFLLFIFQYNLEKSLVVKDTTAFANILAENMAPSIITSDVLAISNTLSSVEYNDKIRQTFALDTSWEMLGAFHKGNDFTDKRNIVAVIKEHQNLWNDGFFYSVVPIQQASMQLGYVVVVASLGEFYVRVLQQSIAIIFIFALFVTFRLKKVLAKSILEPISSLDEITSRIVKTKNLDYEIPIFNNDEIGDLAKNFKSMISSLNNYHDKLNAQKDMLYHQANYDLLTKLPNRALFYDRLEHNIHIHNRKKENFALFFIDLDKFKTVNDSLGHDYGDKLLKKISSRLKNLLRQDDTLARFGGDEFVVIINNLKDFQSASILAQKIIDTLKMPVKIDTEEIVIGCSIGISLCPQNSTNANELLKYADIAMYSSKEDGGNTYNYYVEKMTQEVLEYIDMQKNVRRALDNKEFIVHYQPQYDARNDKIIGLEALARWQDPKKGLVFPGAFIEFAERAGMVVEINHQIMEISMMQAKAWYDEGKYFGKLSINISIEQIENNIFIDFMKTMLNKTKCNPNWIVLELTESQIMKSPKTAIVVLNELSDLGIEIAIDDFGTGHSSLSYLKHLPINKLKIDRSFIIGVPHDKDDCAIVDAIVAISKSLNLDLVAEGVETVAQKEFLISKNCYTIQGYFYDKPISVEEISKKLISN